MLVLCVLSLVFDIQGMPQKLNDNQLGNVRGPSATYKPAQIDSCKWVVEGQPYGESIGRAVDFAVKGAIDFVKFLIDINKPK